MAYIAHNADVVGCFAIAVSDRSKGQLVPEQAAVLSVTLYDFRIGFVFVQCDLQLLIGGFAEVVELKEPALPANDFFLRIPGYFRKGLIGVDYGLRGEFVVLSLVCGGA